MTGNYYADLLRSLRQSIKTKRRGKLRRGVLLQQDNAPVHTSKVAMAAVKECGYEFLPHTPYSSDLAPSHYHLFGNLKKHLHGRRFEDDDLTGSMEKWVQGQDIGFYR